MSKLDEPLDKLWYPVKQVLEELKIDETQFIRKLQMFNLETRNLPGLTGKFISRHAYSKLRDCYR
jgi:hypothetical protein